jgi:hypothetical protein
VTGLPKHLAGRQDIKTQSPALFPEGHRGYSVWPHCGCCLGCRGLSRPPRFAAHRTQSRFHLHAMGGLGAAQYLLCRGQASAVEHSREPTIGAGAQCLGRGMPGRNIKHRRVDFTLPCVRRRETGAGDAHRGQLSSAYGGAGVCIRRAAEDDGRRWNRCRAGGRHANGDTEGERFRPLPPPTGSNGARLRLGAHGGAWLWSDVLAARIPRDAGPGRRAPSG